MKKWIALLVSLTLVVGLFAACGSKKEENVGGEEVAPLTGAGDSGKRELNLFTWAGMFPDDVLRDFTEQTGIKINYSNFDTDETMLAKLQAASTGSYDVIIANDYIIEKAIQEGLVGKLDTSKIPNFSNINPLYQGQFYDPTDEYTVPYGAGVQTILYNPDIVDVEITGYEDLWNPALENQIGIIANPRVINGMALKTMGESYNTEDLDKIEEAGAKLIELAPNIRRISDDNLQDYVLTGEVSTAIMYTSQVTLAKVNNPDLKVVFPKEGIGFGIMANFVPENAPHKEEAYEFINYILDPEVSAKCFEFTGYYSTNVAADEFISPEFKEFLTFPEELRGDMEMIQGISKEAEEVHNRIWLEFETSRG